MSFGKASSVALFKASSVLFLKKKERKRGKKKKLYLKHVTLKQKNSKLLLMKTVFYIPISCYSTY